MRYRIGEFARLCAISIKTLRFYDATGLLAPAEIDPRTRYRYYDASQLADLAAIRALKDLGASLGEIKGVLSCSSSSEHRKLFEKLRRRAIRTLDSTQRSLRWIDLALEDAAHDDVQTHVILRECGEMRVASIHARIDNYEDVVPLERTLAQAVQPDSAGETRGVLWHRCAASGVIEAEPFVELRAGTSKSGAYEQKSLPGAHLATAYCESSDVAATRTYDAIDRWIHGHDFKLDGPKREIYLGKILEIQFPVRPA